MRDAGARARGVHSRLSLSERLWRVTRETRHPNRAEKPGFQFYRVPPTTRFPATRGGSPSGKPRSCLSTSGGIDACG